MTDNRSTGVVGASGYAGAELVSYLLDHPSFDLKSVFSTSYTGEDFSDHYPRFRDRCELTFREPKLDRLLDHEVLFLSVPHGTSMDYVPRLRNEGPLIVDLAADYRFSKADDFETVYDQSHVDAETVQAVPYGLPEHFEDRIRGASFVANPGCYATSMLVPLLALETADLLTDQVFVDAKSGVSGAGRSPSETTSFVNCNEDIHPYSVGNHRHEDEVNDKLSGEDRVNFVPHVIPVERGIESALYVNHPAASLEACLRSFAEDHVTVRYQEEPAGLKAVAHQPYVDLTVVERDDWSVVFSCLDNLGKGAASQAVQNANLMAGLEHHRGIL